jgi:hypothetical protein
MPVIPALGRLRKEEVKFEASLGYMLSKRKEGRREGRKEGRKEGREGGREGEWRGRKREYLDG